MRWSFRIIFLLMLLASTYSYAQTSFQGLLPGKTAKTDVEKILGQGNSVKGSTTLLEYGSRGGAEKIYVQYDERETALRIELILAEAAQRSQLIGSMKMPQEASAAKKNQNDRLEEYFQCPACIVYTYGGANVEDGVTRVAYYSPALYEAAQARPGESIDPKKIAQAGSEAKPGSGSNPTGGAPPTTGGGSTQGAAGATVTSDIPSIGGHVTSFRFFEGDAETPAPSGLRQYKTEFARATTRAVYYELNIRYDDGDRPVTFTVTAIWHKDRKAEPLARQDLQSTKPAGWATSTRAYGYGFLEPGKWEAGTYTVEIQISGNKVATGSFVVN